MASLAYCQPRGRKGYVFPAQPRANIEAHGNALSSTLEIAATTWRLRPDFKHEAIILELEKTVTTLRKARRLLWSGIGVLTGSVAGMAYLMMIE